MIADQLRRAFTGDPWYGPPLRQLLSGITADEALRRPLPRSHTIWELVLHIEVWMDAALQAVNGAPMPDLFGTPGDWPAPRGVSSADWTAATERLFESAERLAKAIERFPEGRLQDTVPGREYSFYHVFHGVVQHSVYHGGQIALLKRA